MTAAVHVAEMAQHMLDAADDVCHAASPLSAWLLRELIGAPADDVPTSGSGLPVPADALLRSAHPAVHIAVGLWVSQAVASDRLRFLSESWGNDFGPHDASLDAWVAGASGGTFATFPISLEDDPMMALMHPELVGAGSAVIAAVASSTSARWLEPPMAVPAGRLSPAWAVRTALRQRDSCGLVWDRLLGVLGVTVAVATTGLFCVSVIADPEVDALRVMAAAHRIGERIVNRENIYLTAPPERESSWWSMSDAATADLDPFGRPVNTALTPAWQVHDDHDMYHSGLDYFSAFKVRLCAEIDLPKNDFRAQQVAVARYDDSGMAACSVTAMRSVPVLFPDILSARMAITETPAVSPQFTDFAASVTLEYTHPYAAVAYSVSEHPGSPWHAMPMWSTWVGMATEP